MLTNFFRIISVLLLVLSLTVAQRFTTTNAHGLTIVGSRTTDDDGDTIIRTISTIGRATPTSTRTLTTSGFTTQSYNPSPTASVLAGTILDYTSYKSRIDSEVASISASKLNAFAATAVEYGLRPVSSAHRLGTSSGVCLIGFAAVLALFTTLL